MWSATSACAASKKQTKNAGTGAGNNASNSSQEAIASRRPVVRKEATSPIYRYKRKDPDNCSPSRPKTVASSSDHRKTVRRPSNGRPNREDSKTGRLTPNSAVADSNNKGRRVADSDRRAAGRSLNANHRKETTVVQQTTIIRNKTNRRRNVSGNIKKSGFGHSFFVGATRLLNGFIR